jgi:hypothetical protein
MKDLLEGVETVAKQDLLFVFEIVIVVVPILSLLVPDVLDYRRWTTDL